MSDKVTAILARSQTRRERLLRMHLQAIWAQLYLAGLAEPCAPEEGWWRPKVSDGKTSKG